MSKTNKKGFSIGESILSIFILGVSMLAIMSLFSTSLREFHDERDSVIASMLAQEGVELARNIRDTNWANRDGATDNTPATFDNFNSSDSVGCIVDINSTQINDCTSSKIMYLNGGFYVHGGGSHTRFRRSLNLDYVGDNLIITSFVSWDSADPPTDIANCQVADKCVFSQSTLTDWGTGV